MQTSGGFDRPFSRKFGASVRAERGCGIAFEICRRLGTVENVVGGVVYPCRANFFRLFSHRRGSIRVNGLRQCFFPFGVVDSGIRCRVQYEMWLKLPNCLADALRLGQIQFLAAERAKFARAAKHLREFPANLPVLSNQENARSHYPEYAGRNSRGISARIGRALSFSERIGFETPHSMSRSGSFQRIPRSSSRS